MKIAAAIAGGAVLVNSATQVVLEGATTEIILDNGESTQLHVDVPYLAGVKSGSDLANGLDLLVSFSMTQSGHYAWQKQTTRKFFGPGGQHTRTKAMWAHPPANGEGVTNVDISNHPELTSCNRNLNFEAVIALDVESAAGDGAVFEVYSSNSDGSEEILIGGPWLKRPGEEMTGITATLMPGYPVLKLKTKSGYVPSGNHNSDHASWINPVLTCGAPVMRPALAHKLESQRAEKCITIDMTTTAQAGSLKDLPDGGGCGGKTTQYGYACKSSQAGGHHNVYTSVTVPAPKFGQIRATLQMTSVCTAVTNGWQNGQAAGCGSVKMSLHKDFTDPNVHNYIFVKNSVMEVTSKPTDGAGQTFTNEVGPLTVTRAEKDNLEPRDYYLTVQANGWAGVKLAEIVGMTLEVCGAY